MIVRMLLQHDSSSQPVLSTCCRHSVSISRPFHIRLERHANIEDSHQIHGRAHRVALDQITGLLGRSSRHALQEEGIGRSHVGCYEGHNNGE